jgi:hypothetical protein
MSFLKLIYYLIKEKQQDIENTCQFLCKINESWKPGGHYLIMLVIDHLEPKNETSTSITHDDPAMELYLSAKKAVYRISNIIENFDCLVFGQDSLSFVVDWGIIGFSTGSITAEFASSFG